MTDATEFAHHPISSWEQHYLHRGHKYRVAMSLMDADNRQHLVGEEWTFIGSKFNIFDDEITLCVRLSYGNIELLRLIDRPGRQQDIVGNFNKYVNEIRCPSPP